jgi:HEAT repeat protein
MSRHVAVFLFTLVATLAVISTAMAQDATAVQELITKLKDKDEAVRLKAAKDLGKMKEKAKDAIPTLTITASRDADEDVRAVAKKALEAIKDALDQGEKDKIREVLDPLVKDLKGKDAEKRVSALDKLADLGTRARDAGADVVEFGVLNSTPSIREVATATLEKIDPEAHKLIVTVLIDKEERHKLDAIQGLEALGRKGKSGLPVLKYYYVQKVTNDRSGGRYAGVALQAMTKIAPDDKGVIDTVVAVVLKPLQANLALPARSLAIELLPDLKMEKKNKVVALVAALDDPVCRAQAVTALGKMGPDAKDALPVLTKLKLDGDKAVREAAAAAVELIKE